MLNIQVLETVVPAFSRLLESSKTESDLEIFETLGEMCMHNNPDYFSDLVELILKYEVRSLKSVI